MMTIRIAFSLSLRKMLMNQRTYRCLMFWNWIRRFVLVGLADKDLEVCAWSFNVYNNQSKILPFILIWQNSTIFRNKQNYSQTDFLLWRRFFKNTQRRDMLTELLKSFTFIKKSFKRWGSKVIIIHFFNRSFDFPKQQQIFLSFLTKKIASCCIKLSWINKEHSNESIEIYLHK